MNAQMIEDRYLRINKVFGQLTGLWPDQSKLIKSVIRFVVSITIITANITQIARVIKFYSLTNLVDQVPFLLLGFAIFMKQLNYIVNESKLRELLRSMVSDWLTKRPKEELAILETYSTRAVLFSYFYRANICICSFMFCMLPCIPPALDVLVPLNKSRERLLIYPAYYFVDDEAYYYFKLGHMLLSAIILTCVFIGCDVNLVSTVQHACALLAISGYRFKHAMDDAHIYNKKDAYQLRDENYAKVCRSIDGHKRAIEYIEKIESCHVVYLFLLIGFVIMAFTVTFVKVGSMEMSLAFLTFCVFIVAQTVHIFFLTIMGQYVINSNEEVFYTISKAFWYNGPVKTQVLYGLVLRKCLTPPRLTCGGLIELNLDSFVQILKASFSYYTVLRTM